MAELLLKIGDGANYEDGDCLCAFSDRHIACVHAQMICHPKRATRNSSGLIQPKTLIAAYMREVMEYRFERVSASQVRRVNQRTNEREVFGPSEIDVRLFLRRRQRKPDHMIFGEDGREIWFGGRSDVSQATMNRVWNIIERRSSRRRSNSRFSLWPMGRLDIRHHLALRTNAITEKQAQDFTEPQYEVDDNGEFVWALEGPDGVIGAGTSTDIAVRPVERKGWRLAVAAKRRRKIQWRDVLADIAEQQVDIEDPAKPIGEEQDDEEDQGRKRYTSKEQPLQRLTRIRRKAARRR